MIAQLYLQSPMPARASRFGRLEKLDRAAQLSQVSSTGMLCPVFSYMEALAMNVLEVLRKWGEGEGG